MIKKLKISLSLTLILLLTLGQIGPRVVLAEDGSTGSPQDGSTDSTSSPQTGTTEEPTDPPADPPEDPPAETTGTEGTGEEQTTGTEETSLDSANTEPSPTPTPEVGIDNEAGVINDVDSTANTGENTIEEPTPTPTPEDALGTAEEVQGEEGGGSNGSEVTDPTEETTTNEVETEGEVGESNEEPSPTPSPSEIETGDAVSVVEAENSVNSTEVDSQVLYQTLNIFVPQEGDIDLSALPLVLVDQIFYQGNNTQPEVNVMAIDNQNFAYLSNEIVSLANTGENSIEGADQAVIDTGDAYSIVSLLNKVNTTIIDSTIHVVTINIFGDVDGNLLLPELFPEEGCCGEAVQIDNTAVVENQVDSTANTGQNSIVTDEEASIDTGDAKSVVNIVNIVNTSFINVVFHYLYINSLGIWTGNFLGLDNIEGTDGGGNLALSSINSSGGLGSCPTCVGDVAIDNQAYVSNNVSSTANTGGNSIDGGEASITTGNAYSAVSIINLINSSIIHSLGFFGFINIFGFLEGDIGGASLFAEPEVEPEIETTSQEGEPGPFVREEGGLLEVNQTTNIGTHVLPGDTITFFVTVKNPGTGIVYDTHLKISLFKDGVDMGGGVFKLNDIHPGRGVKVTTGLVLSEEVVPGEYVARAEAWGLVGPGDTEISAYDESEFLIGGFALPPEMPGLVEEAQAVEEEEVLGAVSPSRGMTREEALRLLFIGMPMTYLALTGIRRRKEVAIAWSRHRSTLGTKGAAALRSLATLLSSFLS